MSFGKEIGKTGENVAACFLSERGFKILKRNFRCRAGEIDIIALKNDTLVFIEVRSRSTDAFGLPQESINRRKRAKVKEVALYYMAKTGVQYKQLRFDVLAVMLGKDGRVKWLEHIENAF